MSWTNPLKLSRLGVLGMNRRNVSYIGRYNKRSNYPLVDNKLKTKRIAMEAGITVPELLMVVTMQHEIEMIERTLDGLDKFVIKPAKGSGGKGILVVHGRVGNQFVKSSGELVSLAGLKRHLTNVISGLHSLGGRPDVAIVETLVEVAAGFDGISHEGVPDIRLIVFKGYPVMGMLRLATRASDGKANLHQGAVGVGLDIGSGQAVAAVQHNLKVTHHPDTAVDLSDIRIPNWQQLLVLASRCYEAAGLGYLGCDIIIDDRRGPMLLELNARPGLSIQIANEEGLLPRLRLVERQPAASLSAEERVDRAMGWFARASEVQQAEIFMPTDAPEPEPAEGQGAVETM